MPRDHTLHIKGVCCNKPLNKVQLDHNERIVFVYMFLFFLYRKNLFMKEKLNKKEQLKLYTLSTICRSNIVEKTNQFKHNNLFINLFCLQYYLSQWSWPKIDCNYCCASR